MNDFEEIDRRIAEAIMRYNWEIKMGVHPPFKAVHGGKVVETHGAPSGWKESGVKRL